MNTPAAVVQPAAVNRKLMELMTAGAIGTGVFLSGFVIREPAPYELYMAGLLAIWVLFGLRIPSAVMPLLLLLAIFVIGGLISMTQLSDLYNIPLYLAVTMFLSLTAVFYASVIARNQQLFSTIFRAWTIAAVGTSAAGIAGYFALFPGAEIFTKYSRAAGAFEDPNVFGPFLVLPGLFLVHRILTGKITAMPAYAVPLLVITAGVFLSFSRGAWGLYAFSIGSMTLMMLAFNQSGLFRLRILIMACIAILLIAGAVLVSLQIPSVAELFSTRAQLVQDYDSARLGRFARYPIGFALAAEKPLGIGPLMFGRLFGEDTHDIWLKALLDYSWLGFAAFTILMFWTLGAGFKVISRRHEWQPYFICAYVVFLGHILLGTIIDIDHWRHFYLLLGMVWAGIAGDHLERSKQTRCDGTNAG